MKRIVQELIMHVFGGAVAFLAIALMAFGIDWVLINVGQWLGVNGEALLVLKAAKMVILVADLVLLIIFVIQAGLKFGHEVSQWRKRAVEEELEPPNVEQEV